MPYRASSRLMHVVFQSLMALSVGCAMGVNTSADATIGNDASGTDKDAVSTTQSVTDQVAPVTPITSIPGGLGSDVVLTGPQVYFVGRTDAVNANTTLLGWPGTQVVGGFSGPSIAVKLRDGVGVSTVGNNGNNYFDVSIDDGAAFILALNTNTTLYPLATGLADANHVVHLTKRTESKIGLVAFDGFVIDSQHTAIPTPTPLTRRLEILGDSGATGYGADGLMPCVFGAATENAAQSYALIAARRLNAVINDIAYSGKGLYQNRDTVNDANKTLPTLWRRVFPDALPVKTWNPNNYIPDAMIMVLSGNDFGASVPEVGPFVAKLKPFVAEVRGAYPDAQLFIMISPLLQYPNRATAKSLVQSLIDAAGDARFSYIDVAPETGTHGWGCDYHLTAAAASAVADQLVPQLQQIMHW